MRGQGLLQLGRGRARGEKDGVDAWSKWPWMRELPKHMVQVGTGTSGQSRAGIT